MNRISRRSYVTLRAKYRSGDFLCEPHLENFSALVSHRFQRFRESLNRITEFTIDLSSIGMKQAIEHVSSI